MRIARALVGLGAATVLLASAPLPALGAASLPVSVAAAALPLAPGVTAYYEMDEAAGTTVMHDSGPHGLDAPVDPAGVSSGEDFDGATGYVWERRAPETWPPSPERIIQVPDNPNLEPGGDPFTIQLRYRSQENFGNITQKGQAQTPGGQWKIQTPQGIPSCLFKGSGGQVATGALTPLNDELWHDLTCVLTSTGVTMYVDGEFRNRKNGPTGTIDNSFPMTVGGKIDCDQIDVTCDYFSGQIDFIKITKAANLSPTAAYSSSCFGLSCAFDSSASADADGSLTRFAWEFGDGQTSTEANPSHTYATPGSYNVRLTVTDNQAVTDRENQSVTVEDTGPIESPIEYVESAASTGNTSSPTVTVPAAATPGDRLLMVLSHNNLTRVVNAPTGVTGWTQLDSLAAGTMGTVAWTKVVEPGDPGSPVTVPLSGGAKHTLTLAAYTGTEATTSVDFASATFVATTSARQTPIVTASAGDWVVSYWADKSSTTTSWTAGGSVTGRQMLCGADGGRICSLFADSGDPLPPGPYGNIEATTDAPSDQATMWSFVLAPSTGGPPPNQPPTADFSFTCMLLDCGFDSSGSVDPDGTITSYAWDFDDGQTSTQADPSHTFPAAGSYEVELTVTDDDGDSDTVTTTVDVQDAPVESQIDHVGSAAAQATNSAPRVTVPATAAVGDRLVLALSLNNTSRTVSEPTGVTGWTQLDSVVAGDMRTVMWTKVVQAGDPGTQVTVPLSGSAKHVLTVAAYTGVDPTQGLTFAAAADTANHADRVTPAVTAPEGAWVISYWADKSSTTTSWTAPGSVTGRQMLCGVDGGRICSLFADSGGAVPAGPYPGATATTDAPSAKATTWSIVLAPSTGGPPPNQPPTADFSFTCTLLDCGFDSSGSVDPDGTITSYAWDFDDGQTSTQADPSHTFPAAGSYEVELTVTDDDGDSDTVTTTVDVQDAPVESQIDHVGSAAAQATNSAPRVTVPATAAVGDRLVLALSLNNTSRTVSEPTGVTGWTQLDSVVAGDMRTVMWTKVVQAGDPGTQVTVPLSGSAKHVLTVAAYTGVDPTQGLTFAAAADTANHADRVTPAVTAPEGAWVISYWADKSSTTTSWTAPGSVTGRQMLCGVDGGRICSLFADSGGAVPAGPYPGATATTDAPSAKATTWSIVLAPSTAPDQP